MDWRCHCELAWQSPVEWIIGVIASLRGNLLWKIIYSHIHRNPLREKCIFFMRLPRKLAMTHIGLPRKLAMTLVGLPRSNHNDTCQFGALCLPLHFHEIYAPCTQ